MQLSDIRTEVRGAAGLDANDPMAGNAELTRIINRAVRTINAMRDWDWRKGSETITTVANQASYDRDTGAIRTVRVVDDERGEMLEMITPEGAARYNDSSGLPVFWFVEGGKLNLVPTPETVRTLTHHYYRREETLVNDSDTPIIPDDAINMVIYRAAMDLLARADDQSQYRLLERLYLSEVAAQEKNARRAKGSPIIHTRRDWARSHRGI